MEKRFVIRACHKLGGQFLWGVSMEWKDGRKAQLIEYTANAKDAFAFPSYGAAQSYALRLWEAKEFTVETL